MNTDRIHVHPAGAAGTDPAAQALADAITVLDRATEAGVDVSTARATPERGRLARGGLG